MLTLIATLKEHHLMSILFQQSSGYNYLIDQSNDERVCFWAFRTLVHRCISSTNRTYINEFLNELQIHSQTPTITQTRNIELNINNKQLITVNTHLLCLHSDYFKTLFNGSFSERNRTIIPIHLPETIPIESFVHLINLLTNNNEVIQLNRTIDLFHLSDKYLLDYLPYRLVHYILEQFINGITTDIIDIESKPKLVSSLI
ncbi:unnamed protein product, partial [Rotaria sp. Silwood2]